jgi:hypothetical protein
MSADVLIVRTGAANLASVVAAFERLGRSVKITDNAFAVRNAKRVVLPGVGAFGPVARRLGENGLGEAIRHRVEEDLPTLAVCLGLHLLAEGSEEGEGLSCPNSVGTRSRLTRIAECFGRARPISPTPIASPIDLRDGRWPGANTGARSSPRWNAETSSAASSILSCLGRGVRSWSNAGWGAKEV